LKFVEELVVPGEGLEKSSPWSPLLTWFVVWIVLVHTLLEPQFVGWVSLPRLEKVDGTERTSSVTFEDR
jgi:hypothetical protein